MISTSQMVDLASIVIMAWVGVPLNLFNLVATVQHQRRSPSVQTVSLIIISISFCNVVLLFSCCFLLVMNFMGMGYKCGHPLHPALPPMFYLWLTSSCISFWSIAWLSVFYCVKVVSFSSQCFKTLKSNISSAINMMLLVTLLGFCLMFLPFFTLYVPVTTPVGSANTTWGNSTINVTTWSNTTIGTIWGDNTWSNATWEKTINITLGNTSWANSTLSNITTNTSLIASPSSCDTIALFTPLINTRIYSLVFMCFLCPFPLMIMLPTSLRMVIHLCRHTVAMRKNQTQVQSADSYLLVCKLTVALVGVYLVSLALVCIYFLSKFSTIHISIIFIIISFFLYAFLSAVLLAASNKFLKEKLWAICHFRKAQGSPSESQTVETGVA